MPKTIVSVTNVVIKCHLMTLGEVKYHGAFDKMTDDNDWRLRTKIASELKKNILSKFKTVFSITWTLHRSFRLHN